MPQAEKNFHIQFINMMRQSGARIFFDDKGLPRLESYVDAKEARKSVCLLGASRSANGRDLPPMVIA